VYIDFDTITRYTHLSSEPYWEWER